MSNVCFSKIEGHIEDHRTGYSPEEQWIFESDLRRRLSRLDYFCNEVVKHIDEKTLWVISALASRTVTQVEVANVLGKPRYAVCKEVKRLHALIRNRLGNI